MAKTNKAKIIKFKREAVMQAYCDLPEVVRQDVDYMAARLDSKMTEKNPRVGFSHTMALELLGALGMLMCQSEKARRAIHRVA